MRDQIGSKKNNVQFAQTFHNELDVLLDKPRMAGRIEYYEYEMMH